MRPGPAKPGPSGAELARLTETGLAAVQTAAGVTVTPEVRSAGLAGIIALADLAETISKRGGPEPGLRTLAAEASTPEAIPSPAMRPASCPAR